MSGADGTERLAYRAGWGFIWAVTGTVVAKVVGLATLVLLARLLLPGEYGLFAFALVYLAYLETVGDLGTGMALVYWPTRTRDAAQVTFAVNVAMGAALTGLTLLTAPATAAFFRMPEAEPLLRVLAWSFLIKGLGNTHDALARKDLRFRARLLPELGLACVKAGVAVTLALAGMGVWSLVWGQLAGVTISTLLLWRIVPWRPGWHWPADLLRPLLRYGGSIVAVNLLAAVVHHLDAVVVARALGPAALGFYQIAYRVPEVIVGVLVWQASKVMFPAYARLHAAGEELRPAFLLSLRYMSLLAGPLALALFLLAEPLVLTLFGDPWLPAVPVLRALGIYAGLRAIGSQTGEILKAVGRPGLLAALGGAKAALLVPVLLLASGHGLVALAWSVTGVATATTLLNLWLSARLAGVTPRAIAGALRPSAAATAVLALTLAGAGWLSRGASAPAALLLASALGGAVYVAAVAVLDPDAFRQAARALGRDGRASSGDRAVARAGA